MVRVTLKGISKDFGLTKAVNNLSLDIRDKEFFTLLGPSGCGKTTTLRIIAGLEVPDKGDVYFNGERVTHIPAHKRNVGMVFQNYALFPNMCVFDNVAYGLKLRKLPKNEIKKRVREALELVKLEGLEKRMPSQLSGGQQQRVALARALVIEPQVLLLDEPLSNLDAKLRAEMRIELKRLQKKLGITTIYVTHDQEEALCISDRIGVMNSGRLLQVGSPIEIYNNPQNVFVAEFIGASNIFRGKIREVKGKNLIITLSNFTELRVYSSIKNFEKGKEVTLAVRPEVIKFLEDNKTEDNVLKGKVEMVTYLGNIVRYDVKIAKDLIFKVDMFMPSSQEVKSEGDEVNILIRPEDIKVIRDV